MINLLERSTCLKNCYAGKSSLLSFIKLNVKTSEHPFGKMLRTPVPSQHVKDDMAKLQVDLFHCVGS